MTQYQVELRVNNCSVSIYGCSSEDVKKNWRKVKQMVDIWLDEK